MSRRVSGHHGFTRPRRHCCSRRERHCTPTARSYAEYYILLHVPGACCDDKKIIIIITTTAAAAAESNKTPFAVALTPLSAVTVWVVLKIIIIICCKAAQCTGWLLFFCLQMPVYSISFDRLKSELFLKWINNDTHKSYNTHIHILYKYNNNNFGTALHTNNFSILSIGTY